MNEIKSSPAPDLRDLFKDCATHWQQRVRDISAVTQDIESAFATELDPSRRESLARKREALDNAFQTLLENARSPELVIATTGTTSSGKSTLANFLIGDSILPSAVQEMSAGLVKIRHSPHRHTLRIMSTRGATWETGEWDNLDAEEMRRRLEETMDAFREAERTDPSLGALHFEIDWPIRIALMKRHFGLPEETRITILDLPGLKAMNDERNGPVIRENITHALCLVAYNAEETDDKKQRELLNQVVSQVTSMRKTSAVLGRMLFLLNRIDAFSRSDSDPTASLARFKSFVTDQLRCGLKAELPEEADVIEQIDVGTICSLPALLATSAASAWSDKNLQSSLFSKVEAGFKAIFPSEYWDDYPRKLDTLKDDQRRHLIEDTLRYSHAIDFEKRLGKHIAANLPEIALAGPMNDVTERARELLVDLDQLLQAWTLRSENEAADLKQRLSVIEQVLSQEADETISVLRKIEQVQSGPERGKETGFTLGMVLEEIEKRAGSELRLTMPIKDIYEGAFTRPFRELADYTEAVLMGETPVISPLMTAAPALSEFTDSIVALRASPYGRVCYAGGRFNDGAEAQAVEKALQAFAEQLSEIASYVIPLSANWSGDRAVIAFRECASLLLAAIERRGAVALKDELQDFTGLKTIFEGEITFPSFKGRKINLFSEAERWSEVETREEQEILYQRSIRTLFLWRHRIEVTVQKEYQVSGIHVPGLGDLFADFQKSQDFAHCQKDVQEYVLSLVEVFSKNLRTRISKGIDGYRQAIDQSLHEINQKNKADVVEAGNHRSKVRRLLNVSPYVPCWTRNEQDCVRHDI
ncbi:dynamin family protein [Asaia sp. As-1742]|uniref:dynamin family protein n=1 Tax=Asaia sp. As-1742 TaxID=2608325 RepID=UPI001421E243|nr:dynamin family protein [Asaia sp. As-1742]NIE79427.1 hypothetical protein [Asaia sp. As-1742]